MITITILHINEAFEFNRCIYMHVCVKERERLTSYMDNTVLYVIKLIVNQNVLVYVSYHALVCLRNPFCSTIL